MQNKTKEISLHKYRNETLRKENDILSIEEPLEIMLSRLDRVPAFQKMTLSITMRTPGDDHELALGFLITENVITSKDQIKRVSFDDNKINIVLSDKSSFSPDSLVRHFYTTSSCGVCGKTSIEALSNKSQYEDFIKNDLFTIESEVICKIPKALREYQESFSQTGGIHAAGIFTPDGRLIELFEDVGRHNALDKLIGSAFLNGKLPLSEKILALSGRISFELVQKAFMAGISCIVAIGAPSSLAVELAEEYSMSLIGFLKKKSFNVYTGHRKIEV